MKSARVQLYGITGKYVVVNLDATTGAIVGETLFWSDGSRVLEKDLRAAIAAGSADGKGGSSEISTTDDIDEGGYQLFFTRQRAQDAVGEILTDTSTIHFVYDDTAHLIKAFLKQLPDSGGGSLVKLARDAYGRVDGTSSADTDDLPEGPTNLYFTDQRARDAVQMVYNRIDANGDIRVDADGNLRITS